MAPVRRRTRASCAAPRSAEESRGSAGTSSPRRPRGPLGSIAALCLSTLAAACGGSGAADASLRFDDAQPTLEALGRHVLYALARGDTAALRRVRLTELEHNDAVWPELPASAPEVNFPVDYAWTNIENRNRRGLARLLPIFSGRSVRFQWIECRGPIEAFETFRVHTDCWVIFTDDQAPEPWEAQPFKDVLERSGGYKIFRYYDEEPGRHRGHVRR